MSRFAKMAWVVTGVFALAALAGITLLSARRGSETVVVFTLAFTILAAVAATFGAVITWLGNRAAGVHQRQLTAKQSQMAEDIRRLAELTESSLEEARAQRPEPLVRFLVGREKEPADAAVLHRKRLGREINVDSIVAHERDQVLATLPQPKGEPSPPAESGMRGSLSAIGRLSALGSVFAGGGPITEEERDDFAERVEKYADALRDWLLEFQAWHKEAESIFVTHLCFQNGGRVPARGVHVQLQFPDEFEKAEDFPELKDQPRRPRFQRRTLAGLTALARLHSPALTLPDETFPMDFPPISRNVSSPRYRRGSLIVEIGVDKLLHGVPEETDEPVMLRVTDDGEFVIPWEIHAENLAEPATGELTLQIVTEFDEGPPITSLDELLATTRDAEENAEDGAD